MELINKFLIGNRFHVTERILHPEIANAFFTLKLPSP